MSKVLHILEERNCRSFQKKTEAEPQPLFSGFEEGVEIALAWLDQWSRAPGYEHAVENLGFSVRHILRSELFIVIENVDARPRIWYPRVCESASSDPQLVSELAAVRFTHAWQRCDVKPKARRLLAGVPLESALAVPFFRGGLPIGCVAAINKRVGRYSKSDAWILGLAAAILSLGEK